MPEVQDCTGNVAVGSVVMPENMELDYMDRSIVEDELEFLGEFDVEEFLEEDNEIVGLEAMLELEEMDHRMDLYLSLLVKLKQCLFFRSKEEERIALLLESEHFAGMWPDNQDTDQVLQNDLDKPSEAVEY